MSAAETKRRRIEAAMRKAIEDASAHGTGAVLVKDDGSVEHISLRDMLENQQADSPVAQRREQLAEQAAEQCEDDWKTWQMGKDW